MISFAVAINHGASMLFSVSVPQSFYALSSHDQAVFLYRKVRKPVHERLEDDDMLWAA